MKLDPKISKKPLDCFDTDKANDYIGKECYFSDNLFPFANIADKDNKYHIYKGTLLKVWSDGADPYETDLQRFYTYCLPCEWVAETKEKTYRPFKLQEFIDKFEFGSKIRYRHKSNTCVYTGIFNGYEEYIDSSVCVCIGAHTISLKMLLEEYEFEYYKDEVWVPFGVEK